ncbi:MAG: molybdopterin oxidoreductase family protein [Geminicoccaceae bacterium]|nr:molybdopterin oxidoreductase family protein [Geminicoccaceae bacterium]
MPESRRASVRALPSVCPHDCPSVCALEIEKLEDGRLGQVRGAQRNPYTAGVICAKVARYAERFHHPERLGHPLQRIGEKGRAAFRRIGWDDALDQVAEAFLRAEARYGAEAVWPYFYAGTMGLVQRDGINRLRHAKRYSGMHATFCTAVSDAGWRAGHGLRIGTDSMEIQNADLIVLWGSNAVHTQVNVMTHVVRARRARGARLVVIDPYRTPTAAQADLHLVPRPGTDGALACAVMHVLFRDDLADRGYLATYSDVPDELEAHLERRDPVWAAAITGIEAAEIETFARLCGTTRRAYFRFGYGFTRMRNGAAAMHAASSIPVVTGAWQHEGGGSHYHQADLYHFDKTMIEGLDVRDPDVRILDQSRIGPVLTGERRDLGDGPPVAAMLIQNTNPAAVAPELERVHQGLARDDLFVCVHEQFMTETARFADVVLPATMFLEHDDIYQASGHTRMQIARALFEPFAECRTNHFVIAGLARRVGAEHPGFRMTEWQLIDDLLRRSGWPDAEIVDQAGGYDAMPDFRTSHRLDGFPTPNGRFHFKPDWAAIGPDHERMPALPDHMPVIDERDEEHPFRLVAAPARNFLNTSFTETPTSRAKERRPTVLVHPDDAVRLGLEAGARVRLGNRRGSVVLHLEVREGQQPGTVVVESIWPKDGFEEGLGINALVSADPAPPNGGAVFHDTAVWLRPAPIQPSA